ncbi:GDSL-type esterase/lipase family protein [Pectobacterium brasiliense]|uniref:GDSL-type esterase/lipase family protein n=1 Tax=Pectobacterium brasiliense TaxID=180957 RepID=UPI001968F8DC|nr:rhamnogalacturonan acetylesterase [Pectobacterium brasiliense]
MNQHNGFGNALIAVASVVIDDNTIKKWREYYMKYPTLFGALALSVFVNAYAAGGNGDSSIESYSNSQSSVSATKPSNQKAVTIHMLGDSTMTHYTDARRPQMGWGEAMPQFFNSNVTVKNWALGGRSSRSFFYEATRWPEILPQIKAGDYVIIQFGHNDQKTDASYAAYGTYAYCSDGTTDGEKCSGSPDAIDPTVDKSEHSYYQFLKRYITAIKAKGAYPILMTPIVRKYFAGTTIKPEGLHNVGVKNGEIYERGNYPAAMKKVAAKYNVPLVDLTTETKTIVEAYGDAAAKANLYIAADSTHPQILFANLIAKRAVEGMSRLGILKNYMVSVTSLIASPNPLAWGTRYTGVATTKEMTVSAFDLNPDVGTVTVQSPSKNFELSFDQTAWKSSLNTPYTNGSFTKTVYVRFKPSDAVDYNKVISFTLGSSTIGSLAVSGKGVPAGAGLDSYASWFSSGSSLAPTTDGILTATDATVSNLTTTAAKVMAVDGQDTSVVRYVVDTWTSRDNTKYLQFMATPTGSLNANKISMHYATSGGSTVQADMEYSTDNIKWTRLNGSKPLSSAKDVMTYVEYDNLAIQVPSGKSLYIRIYPWNTAGTAGKSLALYGVKVTGKVSK